MNTTKPSKYYLWNNEPNRFTTTPSSFWSIHVGITATKITKIRFHVGANQIWKTHSEGKGDEKCLHVRTATRHAPTRNVMSFNQTPFLVAAAEARRLSVMNRFMHAFIMSPRHHNRTHASVILECEQHSLFSAVESPYVLHNGPRRYQSLYSTLGKCRWCRRCKMGRQLCWLMLAQREEAMALGMWVYLWTTMADLPKM